MQMSVDEYAKREGIKWMTAYQRLNRRCRIVSKGIYEVPDNFKAKKNTLPEKTRKEIERLSELGFSATAIREKTGCSFNTIKKYRTADSREVMRKNHRFIAKKLRAEGKKGREIAEICGVSISTVWHWLRKEKQ